MTQPEIGQRIAGRYRLESVLARGGMALVYRAHDERLDRRVAVKVLSSPYASDPAFVKRFLSEARTAASISHPHLVHVYDSGSDGPIHYIVMELLEHHRSLREELAAHGSLPPEQVLAIATEVLAGLAEVHRRGLVHCDVKSGNVMIGPGPAKLIDFGIARTPTLADEGRVSMGSLPYMAPEQIEGAPLTPATDLYGLGVVMYEALSGRLPYEGATLSDVAAAQRRGRPPPLRSLAPGVSPRLEAIVMQAIAPRAQRRFLSAAAMSRALAAVGEEPADETQAVPTPRAEERDGKRARRQDRGRTRPGPARRRRAWSATLGPLLVLGAAVAALLIAWMVATGAFQESPPGEPGEPVADPTPAPTPLPAGLVRVPDTIGMTDDVAIQAVLDAGLRWQIRCRVEPGAPPEIHDQEPPPGTVVEQGSQVTMFSRQLDYCRRG